MSTQSRWQYFTVEELTCNCGCGRYVMHGDFMGKLLSMRIDLGFTFPLSSAFRCPEYNEKVSKSGRFGPHTTGRAVDIAVSHERAFAIVAAAKNFGFTGVGINQKGDKRFVHLDDLLPAPGRPRPHVWSY